MPYAYNGPVRIWWDEHGAGPPALLCMGHSYGSVMWHRAVAALAVTHRVLTFDNRGVGHTDAPRPPYSIADFAADGVAVMDAAGVDCGHVYGASMGGLTAQELALAYPGRVRSLVLACTGCVEPEDNPSRLPFPVQKLLLRVFVRIKLLQPRKADKHYGAGIADDAVADDLALLQTTRVTARGLFGQAVAIGTYSSRRRLGSIGVPTLVIHGDRDEVVALDKGRELAKLIPGARLEVLEGAGHNYLTAVDGEANRMVLDFWSQVESEVSCSTSSA